jgi:uncharacterized membrane protein YhhN
MKMSRFAGITAKAGFATRLVSVAVLVSMAAGLSYPAIEGSFGHAPDVVLKGLCVSALAVAALFLRSPHARWLAFIMAAGAVGDVLLELPGGLIPGGAAFAIGHCAAIALYLRHRRQSPPTPDKLRAAALIGWGFLMPTVLMPTGAPIAGLILYSVLLCGMAAAALLSRFPRHLVALGALLFVVSDTFLIMRLGGRLFGGATIHGLIVWYSYYAAQLLVFLGIARGATPLGDRAASRTKV